MTKDERTILMTRLKDFLFAVSIVFFLSSAVMVVVYLLKH